MRIVACSHANSNFQYMTPNPLINPKYDYHCWSRSGHWFYIDLHDMYTINLLKFRLHDKSNTAYTYNLAVSSDRENWKSLAAGKVGVSWQVFLLEEPIPIRYIKMEGTNSGDPYLRFMSVVLDLI